MSDHASSAPGVSPGAAPRGRGRRGPSIALAAALALGITGLFAANVSVGSSEVRLRDLLDLLAGDVDPVVRTILLDLRIPMALMSIVVGAALAVGGCGMQTILRNPLASPFTLGISSAAAFGAAVGLILETSVLGVGGPQRLLFRDACGDGHLRILLSARYRPRHHHPVRDRTELPFQRADQFLQYIADEDQLQSLVFWTFGSLLKTTWDKVAIVSAALALGALIYLRNSWRLTALLLGDEEARGLGVNVAAVRRVVLITVSVLAAAAVAFVGTIGFVGLVAPHIARSLVGEDQRVFMPISALLGAGILSASFLLSKLLVPGTILPVGMITAFVGIPFFVSIIFRGRGIQR